jgi:hypothetical protein
MSKLKGTICLSLMFFQGCTCSSDQEVRRSDIEQRFLGKPVGSALDFYNVGFEDLQMLDEPPGVLNGVSFNVKIGESVEPVYLWLHSQSRLFSEDRHWDYQSIRKAKIIGITSDPVSRH